ncbi:MAG: hypothetical protein HRU38_23430 [Saccharospirillaceae bacterium]|nr:hypothetical protein [Saccharospirillaceae bacterium]
MNIINIVEKLWPEIPKEPLTVEQEFENKGLDLVSLNETCRNVLISEGKVAAIKHINSLVKPSPPLSLVSTKNFVEQLEKDISKN